MYPVFLISQGGNMRKIGLILALTLGFASASFAGDGRNFTIRPAATWTVSDNVTVNYWFTENGADITPNQTVTGMVAGTDVLVDGVAYLGSGRTVCLNAVAFRAEAPTTTVVADPACFRFPFGPLEAPTLLTP